MTYGVGTLSLLRGSSFEQMATQMVQMDERVTV
jgi:hypothetical protein